MRPLSIKMMLGDVAPLTADYGQSDSGLADGVSSGEFGVSNTAVRIGGTDRKYVSFGEFRSGPTRAFVRTSLCGHVGAVVAPISQEKMLGADTLRVVAPMANEDAGGDRPDVHFPRNPMSPDLSLSRTVPNLAIAVGSQLPLPFPTAVGFLYSRPKTVSQAYAITTQRRPVARLRTKPTNERVSGLECGPAGFTVSVESSTGVFLAASHILNLPIQEAARNA